MQKLNSPLLSSGLQIRLSCILILHVLCWLLIHVLKNNEFVHVFFHCRTVIFSRRILLRLGITIFSKQHYSCICCQFLYNYVSYSFTQLLCDNFRGMEPRFGQVNLRNWYVEYVLLYHLDNDLVLAQSYFNESILFLTEQWVYLVQGNL